MPTERPPMYPTNILIILTELTRPNDNLSSNEGFGGGGLPEMKYLLQKFCYCSLYVAADMCINKPVTKEVPYSFSRERG
jgi:hypothetical protein